MRRVALVAALGLAATVALGVPAGAAGTHPAGVATVPDGTGGKVAGVAVPDVAAGRFGAEVARLRRDGINTLSMFVWWLTPTRRSTTLAPYAGTVTDATLTAEIRTAAKAGLKVTLTPLFYCGACEGGWRGTVDPADVSGFFAGYTSFVDHYARLAQQARVSTFFAGSEMTSLERYTSRWDAVVASVRRLFRGTVGYEENWDVLGQARFLDRVDVIGVSAYFPLDDAPAPTLAQLRADWTSSRAAAAAGRDWSAELDGLAAATRKPIVFGEVGYMSGDYAAKQPFLNFGGQADWQLQSDLYQALLETFSTRAWWGGVVWWEWFPSSGNAFDNSRSPRGKKAEELLARWYADGWRPVDADRPLVLDDPAGARAAAAGAGRAVPVAGPAGAHTAGGIGTADTAALIALTALLGVLALACWATLAR